MPIDQKISDQFRVMLGFAIQNKTDDFAGGILEVGAQRYEQFLTLAVNATGHLAVDAAERYPTDADLKKIASIGAEARTHLPITEEEIYLFLSKVVFGRGTLADVCEDRGKASLIPMYALANLLIILSPSGTDQWSYLDVVESAIEAADNVNAGILPSMVYRFGRKE
jgi:hypothetical protein